MFVENRVDNVDFSTGFDRKSSKIRLLPVENRVDIVENRVA